SLLLRCAQFLHIFHLSDTMIRVVLLVLLTLPASMAIECISSQTLNGDDLYVQKVVCRDSVKYCYSLYLQDQHLTDKGCGIKSVCKTEGDNYVDVLNETAKCCSGDLCNTAARSSLVLTVLAAAAAAFH
ncbi:hypothetical protein PENTCL1PPCAC_21550, partial [Pristionchus entomophagus]